MYGTNGRKRELYGACTIRLLAYRPSITASPYQLYSWRLRLTVAEDFVEPCVKSDGQRKEHAE